MTRGLRWTDVLAPLVVAVVVVVELLLMDVPGKPAAGALELAACALLVLRRHATLVTATAAAVLGTSPPWVGPAMDDLASPILISVLANYALGRFIASHVGLLGLGTMLLAVTGGYLFTDLRDNNVTDVVFVAALMLPPYLFGRVTRRLALQAEQLEQQQELVRQAAVRDERDRIAREVHDVIAHSISAMVVQVAAARDLVRQQPERVEQLLDRVAETGRTAIAETGRLLHVIRDSDDELGLAPTPGLRDLDALVGQFRADGLAVDLVVDGLPEDLPAVVDVSSYRIAREALTNALRYSSGGSVRLEVLGTSEGVTIRATNPCDGRTGLGSGLGSGLGLSGLAERVTLLGGRLRHGVDDRTFELVATLPLEQREPV